jgi:hypothetical protein
MTTGTRPMSIHVKTPSLRDLMLGKKTVKALPDNFFERVLELEIKLKKGFSLDVLQELVNYYSVRNIINIHSARLNISRALKILDSKTTR